MKSKLGPKGVWLPATFEEVSPGTFEGKEGLVVVGAVGDADLVDFSIIGPKDSLWVVEPKVVAVVHGPASAAGTAVTFVVGDEVRLSDADFEISQTRCTYVSRGKGDLHLRAQREWLAGGAELKREGFTLDGMGHLLFGPIPVPTSWLDGLGPDAADSSRTDEDLLFGGGFLSFGSPAPESGFDLLLLPAPVERSPISRHAAERSSGQPVTEFVRWGCRGWWASTGDLVFMIFRDPLGYAWRAEYRRGALKKSFWQRVLSVGAPSRQV